MTAPTPTPPCLGEREAVARHTAICDILFYKLSANEDHGEAWIDGQDECVDAIIAQHIEPLRTENQTLRAERDAAIARAEANLSSQQYWMDETKRASGLYIQCRNERDAVEIDFHRVSAKLAQAEGEIATMRGVLKRLGAFKPFKPFGSFYDELSARRNFARATLTNPEPPHGE